MANNSSEDVQKQVRELLRAQQDAYLAAVKAWRESFAAATAAGVQPPPWPESTSIPTPAEMAEASYAFAARLLADQSAFMTELSKAMASPEKKA